MPPTGGETQGLPSDPRTILAGFARTRDRAAIRAPGRTLTFAALHDLVERTIRAARMELVSGEAVGIVMAQDERAVAALLAARASGFPTVLLPPALPAEELRAVLSDSAVRYVLLPGDMTRSWPWGTRALPVTGMTLGLTPNTAPRTDLPPSIAQLTSGSLGPSRLALRTWEGIDLELDAVRARLRFTPHDSVVCAASIAHSYGLMGGLLAPLLAGSHVTLAEPGDTGAIFQGEPTVLFGIAATYIAMLPRDETPGDLVRFALSAGAPLPPGLFDAWLRHGIAIRQDYGTTETGTIAIDSDEEVHPNTVGSALPHVEVQIGPPRNAPLDRGENGEIQVRSRAVAIGYLTPSGMIPATEAGWYHTHDVGSIDAGGRIHVGRRLRAPLIISGEEVRPDLIERHLRSIPEVREVAVVPVERDGTPVLKAIVATDLAADTMRQECARILPPAQRPAIIQIVETLPRSPAGKVLHKYIV